MKRIALVALLVACSAPTTPTDGGSPEDAAIVRRVTITNAVFNDPGPGVRLADGTVLPAGSGDLWIQQRSVISLFARAPIGLCDMGTFATLDAVPADLGSCLLAPSENMVLAANTSGTNQWVGRAWLVFASTTDSVPIYRARVVSDATASPSITLTFEYQPL